MAEQQAEQHPVPEINELTRPWWEASKQHRFILPHCNECDTTFWYPREYCPGPRCMSNDLSWVEASGKGTVHTYTVIRQALLPYFQERLPYLYAVIQLAEGPRFVSNVLCEIDEIEVGMPVEAVFDDIDEDWTLVKFKPAAT